ncbi:MAG: dihydropteroate synthase, partial [Elusimicrobiota bacterium]|nr:dihydropteroate synthase [Elusimicrobiota bacterium]
MIKFPLIMGILNVTPDSFYDGGKYTLFENAINRAEEILSQGGDIVDVGAESTRPGCEPVSVKEEIARALPVICEIKRLWPHTEISIDTYNFQTARAALEEGASIINDVSGLKDIRLAKLAKEHGAKLVIMHARATPKDMQKHCRYDDILKEIYQFFEQKTAAAQAAGLPRKD